jgi:hypothetical protein
VLQIVLIVVTAVGDKYRPVDESVLLAAGLAGSWLTFNLLLPAGFAIWVVCVYYLTRQGCERSHWCLYGCPYVVVPLLSLLLALGGYLGGDAKLYVRDLEPEQNHSLDPESRLWLVRAGSGMESYFRTIPNNAAVTALCAVAGPPSRAYTGRLPSAPEAFSTLTRGGTRVVWGQLLSAGLRLGSQDVWIDTRSARQLASPAGDWQPPAEGTTVSAALVEPGCVLIGYREAGREMAAVVDTAHGRVLARYSR